MAALLVSDQITIRQWESVAANEQGTFNRWRQIAANYENAARTCSESLAEETKKSWHLARPAPPSQAEKPSSWEPDALAQVLQRCGAGSSACAE